MKTQKQLNDELLNDLAGINLSLEGSPPSQADIEGGKASLDHTLKKAEKALWSLLKVSVLLVIPSVMSFIFAGPERIMDILVENNGGAIAGAITAISFAIMILMIFTERRTSKVDFLKDVLELMDDAPEEKNIEINACKCNKDIAQYIQKVNSQDRALINAEVQMLEDHYNDVQKPAQLKNAAQELYL